MVKEVAVHLALEFNQWPVPFRLREPFGTISATRLYTHMLAIVYKPQTPTLEQEP